MTRMTDAIPTFVINLARATQRRATLEPRLQELGITATWVEALDVLEATEEEIYAGFARTGPWGPLRPGDVACCQSHKRAWQTFVDSGAPIGLILEDDVVLSDHLTDWVADAAWWPQGVGIVKIERWNSRTMKIVIGTPEAHVHGCDLCPLISRHPGAAAYFVSRAAAQRLLQIDPQTTPMDALLFAPLTHALPREIKVLQSKPALAYQREDAVEQMPSSSRPALPRDQKRKQELSRGWRELVSGLKSLPALCIGRAELLRLPLAPDLEDPVP